MSTTTLPVAARPELPERKARLRQLHVNDLARLLHHNLYSAAWLAAIFAAAWTWNAGWWPVTVCLWFLTAHLSHMKLASFHEASHGTLHPTRFRNDMQGTVIGCFNFIPLTVYRLAHWQHHAYLASPRDPELWPFTDTSKPRWLRVLAAWSELLFGFIYTPILYGRAAWLNRVAARKQRNRIIAEYAAMAVLWGGILYFVWRNDAWKGFFIGYVVSMVLAGMFQTLNKFTEHLGLLGDTALTATRTVVDEKLPGVAISRSMLNIDYHGTHHRYAKVPYYHLPEATDHVYGEGEPTVPLYANYWSAMWDMFKCMGDPKVGRQWVENGSPPLARQVEKAERDLNANKGANWRKVRDDD